MMIEMAFFWRMSLVEVPIVSFFIMWWTNSSAIWRVLIASSNFLAFSNDFASFSNLITCLWDVVKSLFFLDRHFNFLQQDMMLIWPSLVETIWNNEAYSVVSTAFIWKKWHLVWRRRNIYLSLSLSFTHSLTLSFSLSISIEDEHKIY